MKIEESTLILIPVFNYIRGVERLKKFAVDNLSGEWHAVIVDNFSDESNSTKLKNICEKDSRFSYVFQPKRKSLKENFRVGFELGKKILHDIKFVMIWETDADPDIDSLAAMYDVIKETRGPVASVSVMYKNNNEYCYPTHNHWFTDPIHSIHPKYGPIRKAHAVPFLFSIWDAEVFYWINSIDTNFREFLHYDTDFGNFLSKNNWLHLRISDLHVGHVDGGKKSR